MFFFVFVVKKCRSLQPGTFLCLNFIRFSKKSQKNDVFFEKKALFLEKKCNFFALFFYIHCAAIVSEPKKN